MHTSPIFVLLVRGSSLPDAPPLWNRLSSWHSSIYDAHSTSTPPHFGRRLPSRLAMLLPLLVLSCAWGSAFSESRELSQPEVQFQSFNPVLQFPLPLFTLLNVLSKITLCRQDSKQNSPRELESPFFFKNLSAVSWLMRLLIWWAQIGTNWISLWEIMKLIWSDRLASFFSCAIFTLLQKQTGELVMDASRKMHVCMCVHGYV